MSLFAKFPRIKTVLQVYRLRTLYKETTKARGLTHKKVPIYNFVTTKNDRTTFTAFYQQR